MKGGIISFEQLDATLLNLASDSAVKGKLEGNFYEYRWANTQFVTLKMQKYIIGCTFCIYFVKIETKAYHIRFSQIRTGTSTRFQMLDKRYVWCSHVFSVPVRVPLWALSFQVRSNWGIQIVRSLLVTNWRLLQSAPCFRPMLEQAPALCNPERGISWDRKWMEMSFVGPLCMWTIDVYLLIRHPVRHVCLQRWSQACFIWPRVQSSDISAYVTVHLFHTEHNTCVQAHNAQHL